MPLIRKTHGGKGPVHNYSTLQESAHWAIALLCVVEFPTATGIQGSHLGHVFGIKAPTLDLIRAVVHEWSGWLILAAETRGRGLHASGAYTTYFSMMA
ncbi:MAG: hypothetical protein NUV72_03510 [Bauldia sp.]|nr:hypothetical protein [Bauldia sp.]